MTSSQANKGLVADKGGPQLAKLGPLEVRLALSAAEVRAAQALRFDVFYREMAAQATPEMARLGLDFDRYDDFCDHLLVVDHSAGEAVVGTYRLLRGDVARANGGFYTAGEFDIAPMLAAHPAGFNFLELGRSCVLRAYRTGSTMQLLWRGIVVYLTRFDIDLMFGCASLPGTDPSSLALPLSYLHHFHRAPEGERVRALPDRHVAMDLLPAEAIDPAEGLKSLPPLIKGYIRTGAYIGDGAVVDHEFGTTDVFIYFPITRINPRWVEHYRKKLGPAGA